MPRLTGVIALLLAAVSPLPLQGLVVSGRLLERGTEQPVPNATVELLGTTPPTVPVTTNASGEFSVAAQKPGRYRLAVRRIGYEPATSQTFAVRGTDTTYLLLRLVAQAVVLAPVSALARARHLPPALQGFYDRVEANRSGRFVTRDRIEEMGPSRTSDLLRSVLGLNQMRTRRGTITRTRGGCEPALFIDGMHVPMYGMTIDELVQPEDLEGIEVYTGAASPPGFITKRDPACTVILVWTRVRN